MAKVKLSHPITVQIDGGEVAIYDLEIKEPTVKELRKITATGGAEYMIQLIEQCCVLTSHEVNQIKLRDFTKISKVIESFLDDTTA